MILIEISSSSFYRGYFDILYLRGSSALSIRSFRLARIKVATRSSNAMFNLPSLP